MKKSKMGDEAREMLIIIRLGFDLVLNHIDSLV